MHVLEEIRADFERRANRSLSLPIAGALVWAVVGGLAAVLPSRIGVYVLLFGTGVIFPLALVVARVRGEQLLDNANPLAKLMTACVFMVNLLWALHISLLFRAPALVPLSVGIGLGLHWVVYSWITGHSVGYVHAAVRTAALVAAWWLFPSNVVTACAAAVVLAYALAIYQMATRRIPALEATVSPKPFGLAT
jgi:hypothetical protein